MYSLIRCWSAALNFIPNPNNWNNTFTQSIIYKVKYTVKTLDDFLADTVDVIHIKYCIINF